VELHCRCGDYDQGALDVVQCRNCRRWAHERCFGFPQMNSIAPADFVCHSCREFPWRQDPDGLVWRGVCICGVDEDVNASCEQCDRWAHAECMGVSLEEVASGLVPFICYTCRVSNGETFPEGPRAWRTPKEVKLALQLVKQGISTRVSDDGSKPVRKRRKKGGFRKARAATVPDATIDPVSSEVQPVVDQHPQPTHAAGALVVAQSEAHAGGHVASGSEPSVSTASSIQSFQAIQPMDIVATPLSVAVAEAQSTTSQPIPSQATYLGAHATIESTACSSAPGAEAEVGSSSSQDAAAPVFSYVREDIKIPHYVERRARFGAAADLLCLYANTVHYFEWAAPVNVMSPPASVTQFMPSPERPLDFLVMSLTNWLHDQSGYASDLASAGKGCIQLPDVDSCFASIDRKLPGANAEDVKFLERVRAAPCSGWPSDTGPVKRATAAAANTSHWTFAGRHGLLGSPFVDQSLSIPSAASSPYATAELLQRLISRRT